MTLFSLLNLRVKLNKLVVNLLEIYQQALHELCVISHDVHIWISVEDAQDDAELCLLVLHNLGHGIGK